MHFIDNITTTDSHDQLELFNGFFLVISSKTLEVFESRDHLNSGAYIAMHALPSIPESDGPCRFIASLDVTSIEDLILLSNDIQVELSSIGINITNKHERISKADFIDKLAKETFGMSVSQAKLSGLCINCKEPALAKCYSHVGRAEYNTSGLCEICFDGITEEE